jgi:sodium-dependent phosphate cotransporter
LFSVGLLGSSLKLFGRGFAETLLSTTSNPIVGLFIGVLVTSVVQSSSMTTSLLVGMVGGGMISVENAIPIVMGANIGTTITNTMVSLVHINRSAEFRRAFAASTVHDMFNICSVVVFLPLQMATDFLGRISTGLADLFSHMGGMRLFNPLGAITKPVIHEVIALLNENAVILCIIAVLLLFVSLHFMVKTLRSVFISRLTGLFQRYIFKTALRSFFVGLVITILVQSSSITTSLVIPLAGAGVLSLIQVFPYTLGANLGTTATAILASLATGNIHAVTIAFAHMCFNLAGIAVFMPLKRIPLMMARKLADYAVKSKLIPIAFVGTIFFLVPLVLLYFWR